MFLGLSFHLLTIHRESKPLQMTSACSCIEEYVLYPLVILMLQLSKGVVTDKIEIFWRCSFLEHKM